ncbi:MAG: nucleotidyltransferase domain-containing protein [Candidatus Aegiribacteria sp.]|nr:nucleotidyltransferase domain-containing protein [Candidatus Aegiribacteria sp.]
MNKNGLPSLGLTEGLFSKVQLRVLGLLFGQPDRSFQSAELIRLASSGVGAVYREISRLLESGLITAIPFGRRKLYRANRNSPIFEELHKLILKTVGLSIPLREAMMPFADSIHVAFIYGSVAKGNDSAGSDIDLMVIGEKLSYPDILVALQPTEEDLNRQISLNLVTPEEWKQKLAAGNQFFNRVAAQSKIFIMGSDDDIS